MKKPFCTAGFVIFLLCFQFTFFYADSTAADRGFAQEEFRRGVQSYYRGAFNDAIVLFEKALSYLPNESLILDWLGNAYYRSGIEGTAIQYWDLAIQNGYGGIALQNKVDVLRERRIPASNLLNDIRFVEAGSFPGKVEKRLFYSQPISALPLSDGSCWVIAYGSNELLQFDVNGSIKIRARGPLNGFDRPMDVLKQQNGQLIVSEFAGDRLTVLTKDGDFIRYVGKKGIKDGELLGPQFLAQDSSGNIFVTDFGNARVSVYDGEGNSLFSFGKKTDFFQGFIAPSGISVIDDIVYVADSVYGTIFLFDTAGNYIDILLPEKTFQRPESMKFWQNYLLVADSNKVYAANIQDGTIEEISNTGNGLSRITCAVPDVNGNLVVTDFKSNEIYVMSKISELISGFFVQVDRVIADNFPKIVIEVRVESKERTPIIGLHNANFFITENKLPVSNQQLLSSASYNDTCDITILVDRSAGMKNYSEQVQAAVREIASAMNGKGTLRIVSAGKIAGLEMAGSPQRALTFTVNQLKTPLTDMSTLDDGIRLAGNNLMNGEKKRAVIFLTDGNISPTAFNKYGLVDLTSFLNNNGINFVTVNLSYNEFAPEINYISEQTGGLQYYVYRPEGIKSIVQDIINFPVGVYQLTYTSNLPTDFGRAFLPVEVETYLLNRSGRVETAYFPPLE